LHFSPINTNFVVNFRNNNQNQPIFIMEDFNSIINSEQLTLVDFFATWCGPCKMMHPVLEQLKEDMPDIRIIKVDVDKNDALCMQYRIQAVPTLMLFRSGELLWQQSGALPLDALKQIIKEKQ